jgi:hypothetical protein
VEADCWKKFPDKIPEKVKLARKKAEEKKAVAAAAVEDEVILGAIDEDLILLIAVEFENTDKYEQQRTMSTTATATSMICRSWFRVMTTRSSMTAGAMTRRNSCETSYLQVRRKRLSLCQSVEMGGRTTNERSRTGPMTLSARSYVSHRRCPQRFKCSSRTRFGSLTQERQSM